MTTDRVVVEVRRVRKRVLMEGLERAWERDGPGAGASANASASTDAGAPASINCAMFTISGNRPTGEIPPPAWYHLLYAMAHEMDTVAHIEFFAHLSNARCISFKNRGFHQAAGELTNIFQFRPHQREVCSPQQGSLTNSKKMLFVRP